MKNYRKQSSRETSALLAVAQKSGLPLDVLGGYPKIVVKSGRELIVEGKCRILEYCAERIGIICGRVKIKVEGRGLNVTLMDSSALALSGVICAVFFEE